MIKVNFSTAKIKAILRTNCVGCHFMKRLSFVAITLFITLACRNIHKAEKIKAAPGKDEVYEKEPADSARYKHLKFDFYLSSTGQLCERKLVFARNTNCNCEFEVYYDSTFEIFTGDTIIQKPLGTIVDIGSFVWIDSSDYSKDKGKVFYFQDNSDGGIREIVDKADPLTFKRLCEYRWGIDRSYVFYDGEIVQGLDLKHLRVLYPPDTSDHSVKYVKDDKIVFYENSVVKGADANSFKVVSGRKWDAEDKYHKYQGDQKRD